MHGKFQSSTSNSFTENKQKLTNIQICKHFLIVNKDEL